MDGLFEPHVTPPGPTTDQAWLLALLDGQLVLPGLEQEPLTPRSHDELRPLQQDRHYLGRLQGLDCWALRIGAVPEGWRGVPLRAAMMQMPAPLMGLASRAAQVLEWDRTHRHCGVCGTPTEPKADERARVCPSCQHTAYPRLSPAMMALVWRRVEGQAQLLLARAPHFAPGMFSALAGFVEPGETLEECVHREVAEEVGLSVRELRYYGSQSWPFPHSLMVAFTAQWVAGEIVPQAGEIEQAGWFALDALPRIPPRFSISGHLIRDTAQALGGVADPTLA